MGPFYQDNLQLSKLCLFLHQQVALAPIFSGAVGD